MDWRRQDGLTRKLYACFRAGSTLMQAGFSRGRRISRALRRFSPGDEIEGCVPLLDIFTHALGNKG